MSRFRAQFAPIRDAGSVGVPWSDERLTSAEGYSEFAAEFAGASFGQGLYRVHDTMTGPIAAGWIAEAFPAFAQRATPFGYDWLGRQFALDSGRTASGEAQVLLLEPGTGEALEVPVSFAGFHEQELVDYADAALAAGFFETWAGSNPSSVPLGRDQCVGYTVPLFLGGKDALENLEVSDLEVYWVLTGQLIRSAASLPPGARPSKVTGS